MSMHTGRLIAITFLISICTILSACNDDTVENEPVTVDHGRTGQEKNNEIYTGPEDLNNREDIRFSLDSVSDINSDKGNMFTQEFKPDAGFYKLYGNLLVYNADSSIFIDAYSNNWIIEERNDGALYAREGEVD